MSYQAVSLVLAAAAAKGAQWQVLIVLATHARDDGTGAWPSAQTITTKANLSHRAVRAALADLERDGYIARGGVDASGTVVWNLTPNRWPTKPTPMSERRNVVPTVSESHADMSESRADVSESRSAVSERRAPKPSFNHPGTTTSQLKQQTSSTVREVFDAWLHATERAPGRTKLTPDRRRCIEGALRDYSAGDCLAAVRNIGADEWARGANERGTRFDDIKHALGNGERLERWRDGTPRHANGAVGAQKAGNRNALRVIAGMGQGDVA